ncbi:MAG: class I SAM-dependent methyltransferase [Candidatus Pristimantibacillus lignocellulolyticus]|uniref:Class I SAM-dependent methyltransferase n=1 Tax=Candidatus Pristimantibacillus lignocellulolyticus TaxID=2994561 RepID=A0A9J6ZCH4_9BACL|nr:MAG: class I SAM-dependent methyltransferase [Candidatus Pristimantibacillus lignocellulolyticus]
MGMEWYDMIAKRNGGYKNNAISTTIGVSSEQVFEENLITMFSEYSTVLDAGCGHGEFTLKMSKYANSIIGFDNSIELITIANELLSESKVSNVNFIHTTTKTELPFQDNQFDLIYNRRGPTSIIEHSKVLRSGGIIYGIHVSVDKVIQKLDVNGFVDIEIHEYNSAVSYYPNEEEYAKFLTCIPGNPDYTLPENKNQLMQKVSENMIDNKIGIREQKYIWKAVKA